MQTDTFEREGEFVQVLHCSESHWVLVTNNNCKEKQVMVYDSNCSGLDTRKAVASIIRTPHSYFFLTFSDVQQQEGGSCCGLFALAFAYSLCSVVDSTAILYKQTEFWSHFQQCLKEGTIKKFPQENVLKVPWKAVLCRVNVYCLCRLPYTKNSMITCAKCSMLFHHTCVLDDTIVDLFMWLCTFCTSSN